MHAAHSHTITSRTNAITCMKTENCSPFFFFIGGFPYPSISNEELVALLKNGYRMEKPDNCSPEV